MLVLPMMQAETMTEFSSAVAPVSKATALRLVGHQDSQENLIRVLRGSINPQYFEYTGTHKKLDRGPF